MFNRDTVYRMLTFLVMWLFSFLPISGYLFSNGYLNFYTYQFPFFSGYEVKYLFPLFVYSPELGIFPSPYSVLTIFMYIIPTENVIILAKIYLVLMFSIIYIILWRLTDLVLKVLNIQNFYVKILLILYFYLLPLYLQLLAPDWYAIILGILALSYVLLNLLDVQINSAYLSSKRIILSGIALGFSTIMDPRFYVWFTYLLPIFLIFNLLVIKKSFRKLIKNLLLLYLISLPFVAYVYYIYIFPSLITTSSITKAVKFTALRPDSLSYIAGFSQNALFTYLFAFISSWWPGVIPASPSILFYPKDRWFYLPTYGFNDQLLLPNDLISYIWLTSLFTFIFISFISVFDKSRRTIATELLLALLFMIGIESGTNFPFVQFTYVLEVLPSKLPIIGGIMATTFAIPFYAEWLNASFSLILAAIGFNYILSSISKIRVRYFIGIILVVLMGLASWQYFNGTLYPSQHTGVFPGNGISLQGFYYPLNPPPQWVHVMDILSTSNAGVIYIGDIGFSERWTNYQFVSFSPPIMPGYMTIPPPPAKCINQTPLTFDIAGIRYFFIDNTSYVPLNSYFIYSYLNDSGLKVVYAKGDVYLLEQPNASIFREARMGIYFNYTNKTVLVNAEWLLYPMLNYTPAIISPVKTSNTVTMVLNPSVVKGEYISLYNDTMNVTVLEGNYIVIANGNMTRLTVGSEANLTVRPWTMIVPESVNLSELRSYPLNFSFNQFMAQFTVNSDPGYLVVSSLPLPNGSVETSNGKALGVNGFGQYVFVANGELTISIKLGFVTNLIITLVDAFFYALFVYFFIIKSLTRKNINIFEIFFRFIIERITGNKVIRSEKLKE